MINDLNPVQPENQFETELRQLLNRHSKENGSNTPDYLLAGYLIDCLAAYDRVLTARDKWFDFKPWGRTL